MHILRMAIAYLIQRKRHSAKKTKKKTKKEHKKKTEKEKERMKAKWTAKCNTFTVLYQIHDNCFI